MRRRRRGWQQPNLTDDILALIMGQRIPFRVLYNTLHGSYAHEYSSYNLSPSVLRSTLSRLRKNGLVARRQNAWQITKNALARIRDPLSGHRHAKPVGAEKNMIVIYDIPESEKRKRDWLRIELGIRGFVILQESVLFGPGPLPKEFIKTLDDLRMLPYLRFFAAKESEIV